MTANETSSFSVRLARCGTAFTEAETYPLIGGDPPPVRAEPKVALGEMCPGQPDHLAVVVGLAPGSVYVTCGDGAGSFEGIVEPHGQTAPGGLPWDYEWVFVPSGGLQLVRGLAFVHGERSVIALVSTGPQWLAVLTANPANANQNEDRALRHKLRYPALLTNVGLNPVPTADAPGGRVLYVGEAGLGVLS